MNPDSVDNLMTVESRPFNGKVFSKKKVAHVG